jgi:hypothetical protein
MYSHFFFFALLALTSTLLMALYMYPVYDCQAAAFLQRVEMRSFNWMALLVHAVAVALWIAYYGRLVDWKAEPPGLR